MSLRGMNKYKLVVDDKLLFLNLINVIFPLQKNAKAQIYPKLMKLINAVLERKKLDYLDIWVEKIIQTYETYHVRHDFMIVCATGTGKTTIMEVLAEAMSEMDLQIKMQNGKFID